MRGEPPAARMRLAVSSSRPCAGTTAGRTTPARLSTGCARGCESSVAPVTTTPMPAAAVASFTVSGIAATRATSGGRWIEAGDETGQVVAEHERTSGCVHVRGTRSSRSRPARRALHAEAHRAGLPDAQRGRLAAPHLRLRPDRVTKACRDRAPSGCALRRDRRRSCRPPRARDGRLRVRGFGPLVVVVLVFVLVFVLVVVVVVVLIVVLVVRSCGRA